ncbi:MAG: hypothetical protein ACJAYJ_002272 [Saprospiraceae bacterium]|jgi:hypothetical protein
MRGEEWFILEGNWLIQGERLKLGREFNRRWAGNVN